MGFAKGGFLRLFETLLYALEFCCAGIILGIFSWFLAVLHDHHDSIPTWERAVEGISGAACLYLIFAVLLTCFLGGIEIFAFLAIVLDVCFIGGFIAIAIMTRHGAHSCSGIVSTPLGTGNSHDDRNAGDSVTNYGYNCRLNKVAFAVSIVGAVLFLFTALVQLALVRNHRKEKKFGPSPANNYTSGSGNRKFWQRKNKNTNGNLTRDAELGAVGAGAGTLAADHHKNKYADPMRPSHDTAMTGSTVAAPSNARDTGISDGYTSNANHTQHGGAIMGGGLNHGTHGGYYTQPQGTGVNPYGYENNNTQQVGTATNY